MTKCDYWIAYMFIKEEGGHWEWGNGHVNIAEVYSGIEWVREIETRISRRYKYHTVKIMNFIPALRGE